MSTMSSSSHVKTTVTETPAGRACSTFGRLTRSYQNPSIAESLPHCRTSRPISPVHMAMNTSGRDGEAKAESNGNNGTVHYGNHYGNRLGQLECSSNVQHRARAVLTLWSVGHSPLGTHTPAELTETAHLSSQGIEIQEAQHCGPC